MKETADLGRNRRHIAIWLLVCCAMVFVIIVVGGLTRLTGSGLSMVEWNPIFGILPPLNEEQWLEVFAQYRQSPEYRYVNIGMTVDGFKSIYWLEYIHRMIGRTIGLAFFFPMVYFWVRRKIEPGLHLKLVAMFILGGMQGVLGWLMVASGLAEDPHVSQYRLTAHLGLAILIFGYMLWVALNLLTRERMAFRAPRHLYRLAAGAAGLSFVTILSGGFVAGLKAGYAYNTFPLMGRQLIPDGLFAIEPWWRNFFENVITAQFDHRLLAIALFIMVATVWQKTRHHALDRLTRTALHLMMVAAVVQVALGISTLLMHVPIALASAHQAVAVVLLTALMVVSHRLQRALPGA